MTYSYSVYIYMQYLRESVSQSPQSRVSRRAACVFISQDTFPNLIPFRAASLQQRDVEGVWR